MPLPPAMTLCDICGSIAFGNLPPFPTNEYQLTLSGLQHVHMLVVKRGTSKEAIVALSRVRHHASLASLRTAADNGCELCALILAQADALLTELETLQNGQRSEDHLPTFDMWLSQREEGGQGFCVWSNSVDHADGARIVPVAAFAFVVSDGDYPSTLIRGRPVTRDFNADAVRRFVNWNTDEYYGLLFQRPTSALLRIPYGADEDGPRTVSVAALPLNKEIVREEYIEMRKQPISQDVWHFQDRVLSRRTLHFATDQMYYECLHHFASEDGLLQRLRYHTPVERLPEGTEHFRRRCLDEDPRSRWCALVWDYGQCSSNGRADKLKALSNVARAFQRLENDVYIAGHWTKSLPESLFWRSLSCKPSGERNAPSWSWASVDGVPAMGLGYSRAHEYPAKIIDVRATLADSRNAFGSVMTAEIELEAPLVPLKLLDKPEADDSGHMFVVAEDSDDRGFYAGFDTIDRNYAQSAGAVRGMQLFALILVLTRAEGRPAGACGPVSSIGALIVTPADDSGDKMMRLGSFSAAEPRLPYARLGLHKTIILV
ncbi:hypothetical protein LMH87_002895 [Akanthomyces muscarius]|uniref:Heterokaryon incompatibility domain-containing protein n=1 Tax=Akanthomyces muscarius TaxID=2231603 RepID=A0A9W8Q783_AKAMU|nr:hypothetical protein LMH87_002895 [Akanthomyces muscarius]KAJ4148425.1 hypothetical protein LMH87_002895 [Akanthomyces muscarius]